MNRKSKCLLIVLFIVSALLLSEIPASAWFSDVLSGASYEFVIGELG